MRPSNLQLIIASMLGAALFYIGSASAGAIKTWASGETLTSSDLNAAFQHIHSLMVGGHGGRLVDADVSSSANIANTKLASGKQFSKAFVAIPTSCTANPCTMFSPKNFSAVNWSAMGTYTATVSYSPSAQSVFFVQSMTANVGCWSTSIAGSVISIVCKNTSTLAAADAAFNIVVFENSY